MPEEKITHSLAWSGVFGPVNYRVTLKTDTDPSILAAILGSRCGWGSMGRSVAISGSLR